MRAAGFLPVAVASVEGAQNLLRQFRAGAVILHVSEERGWEDCARLLATGSPVAVLVDLIRPEVTQRYLRAGCAAVIDAHCSPDQLTTALRRVAAGELRVVLEASRMASGLSAASERASVDDWFQAERQLQREAKQ